MSSGGVGGTPDLPSIGKEPFEIEFKEKEGWSVNVGGVKYSIEISGQVLTEADRDLIQQLMSEISKNNAAVFQEMKTNPHEYSFCPPGTIDKEEMEIDFISRAQGASETAGKVKFSGDLLRKINGIRDKSLSREESGKGAEIATTLRPLVESGAPSSLPPRPLRRPRADAAADTGATPPPPETPPADRSHSPEEPRGESDGKSLGSFADRVTPQEKSTAPPLLPPRRQLSDRSARLAAAATRTPPPAPPPQSPRPRYPAAAAAGAVPTPPATPPTPLRTPPPPPTATPPPLDKPPPPSASDAEDMKYADATPSPLPTPSPPPSGTIDLIKETRAQFERLNKQLEAKLGAFRKEDNLEKQAEYLAQVADLRFRMQELADSIKRRKGEPPNFAEIDSSISLRFTPEYTNDELKVKIALTTHTGLPKGLFGNLTRPEKHAAVRTMFIKSMMTVLQNPGKEDYTDVKKIISRIKEDFPIFHTELLADKTCDLLIKQISKRNGWT